MNVPNWCITLRVLVVCLLGADVYTLYTLFSS